MHPAAAGVTRRTVFVTGATGYIGSHLIPALLQRGHRVRALVRQGGARRLPAGADAIEGDALDAATFADAVAPADTFVHLIGTPHPGPHKAASFRAVDLPSVDAALNAARSGLVRHFVYVSVARPAPVMHVYIAVREAGEKRIRSSGIPATFLRPWYVLGPGHRWPYLCLPFYALLGLLPPTRDAARRLGLVTLPQMIDAMTACIEHPAQSLRIIEVPGIRAVGAGVVPPESA